MRPEFFIYLAVMAGVTYLVRAIPLLLVKKYPCRDTTREKSPCSEGDAAR